MTCTDRRLWLALAISLALHSLPFVADSLHLKRVPKPSPPLVVRLTPPPLPPTPKLIVPEAKPEPTPPPPPPTVKPKPAQKPAVPVSWNNVVRQQLKAMQKSGQFYSPEAIAQRLEGDPVVLFVLDTEGNVSAARIQESSGHPILDRDAVNAVRRLRGLPGDAPREVLLPLRFRLKD
ncbi:MAG: energy transducer TonB [Betaproteobacteria bacterium]